MFSNCFCVLIEYAKVFERVRRVQAAHLHNAVRALSNPSRCVQFSRQRFRFFDVVVKNKSTTTTTTILYLTTLHLGAKKRSLKNVV